MNSVIKVQDLHKTYPLAKGKGMFQAIKGISFSVQKGEVFGILGPNGAGKTTTLEILECLKPQSSGSVEVLGFNNLTHSEEIKKLIGVQLQSSDYLQYLNLGELLNLFSSLYPKILSQAHPTLSPPKPWLRRRDPLSAKPPNVNKGFLVEPRNGKLDLLNLVGLSDKQNELVKNLSGGQKQRFTIATALVNNPELLFLDEPTTGLDPAARRSIWELIKELNSRGITIILTTHYMEEAEFLCHRVAIMDMGKILEIDEPKKLIDRIAQTTQISFLVSEKINTNIFTNIPEVEKVYDKHPKIILEINSLDHINKVVDVLKQNKINFSGFTVKTASLEDVYLDLTGKEYQE